MKLPVKTICTPSTMKKVTEYKPINYKLTLFVKGRLLGKYAVIKGKIP